MQGCQVDVESGIVREGGLACDHGAVPIEVADAAGPSAAAWRPVVKPDGLHELVVNGGHAMCLGMVVDVHESPVLGARRSTGLRVAVRAPRGRAPYRSPSSSLSLSGTSASTTMAPCAAVGVLL